MGISVVLKSGFPLLVKELTEQAARRRTYVVRVVYLALLFAIFTICFWDKVSGLDFSRHGLYRLLGSGKDLFQALVGIQFAGIYLFLPGMVCGSITAEKERDSLQLLFLTDMGPWEILLQKYLSRIIPVFTFLLASLPLMAVCHALGGVPIDLLLRGIITVVAACLQVGAFAILASAWCRSTTAAYLSTYIGGLSFFFFLPILDGLRILSLRSSEAFATFPVYIFFGRGQSGNQGLCSILYQCLPILISTAAFLILARIVFLRRAFVPAGNALLKLFKWVDSFLHRVNLYVGDIQVVRDCGNLPQDNPLAWREREKKSLGKFRYLLRVFLLMEIPVLLFISFSLTGSSYRGNNFALSFIAIILWIVAALVFVALSASSIVGERVNQTLEVLLTTPISGREIIKQKRAGLGRLHLVFGLVFATLFIAQSWWNSSNSWAGTSSGSRQFGSWMNWFFSIGLVVLFLPMCSWFGLWIGLKCKSRIRAIITAVVGMVAWVVLPFLLVICMKEVFHLFSWRTSEALMIFSPGVPVVFAALFEDIPYLYEKAWVWALATFVLYGGITLLLRRACLRQADRRLGRVEGSCLSECEDLKRKKEVEDEKRRTEPV